MSRTPAPSAACTVATLSAGVPSLKANCAVPSPIPSTSRPAISMAIVGLPEIGSDGLEVPAHAVAGQGRVSGDDGFNNGAVRVIDGGSTRLAGVRGPGVDEFRQDGDEKREGRALGDLRYRHVDIAGMPPQLFNRMRPFFLESSPQLLDAIFG